MEHSHPTGGTSTVPVRERDAEKNILNPRYNGPGYKAQNLAVYNCEFLKMLRHYEGFVVRKLFKLKENPNIKTFI
jgi:hypothetical protein